MHLMRRGSRSHGAHFSTGLVAKTQEDTLSSWYTVYPKGLMVNNFPRVTTNNFSSITFAVILAK